MFSPGVHANSHFDPFISARSLPLKMFYWIVNQVNFQVFSLYSYIKMSLPEVLTLHLMRNLMSPDPMQTRIFLQWSTKTHTANNTVII